MAEYLILIEGGDTEKLREWSPGEFQGLLAKHLEWTETMEASGNFLAADKLCQEGRYTLRPQGKELLTDGPFTESKEGLGGYYKIQAETVEEALEIARSCPVLDYGARVTLVPIDMEYCEIRAQERLRRAQELGLEVGSTRKGS